MLCGGFSSSKQLSEDSIAVWQRLIEVLAGEGGEVTG